MPDSIDKPGNETRANGGSAPLVAYVLKQRSTAFRIFLLVVAVAAMTLVRAVFGLIFPNAGFFSFYFPAVMIVTIMAGWQMGLACVGLSVVISTWLFMTPAISLGPHSTAQWLTIASFVVAAALQVGLAQWLRSVLQQMERNENRYRQLVSATSGIVWTTDAAGNVEEPQPGWLEITGIGWPDYAGRAWMQSIHEDDRGRLLFQSWDTDATGAHHAEVRIRHAPSGEWRWFAIRAVPIRDTSGNPREWVTIITDIHERKLARDRRELVIGELRHRLKNLFTVIGSLAQSSRPRGAPIVDEFIAKLNSRLRALSAAADLVMARGRGSLDLGSVIQATLAPFAEERSSRFEVSGPAIELSEETGGAIALAIHELTTNALKYGALSVPEGKVRLTWWRSLVPDGERIEIEWQESGGPICTQPTQSGFGMRVIQFAAAREKSGEVTLDYPPKGLYCRISFVVAYTAESAPSSAAPIFEDAGIL
ncbi:MAG TPA: HWE histidine kinase domain-containing protein [Rhizomicrobium sp.]|nr:HWE histidine kinase domain-containing protein [Rhizomicrobium sp.]